MGGAAFHRQRFHVEAELGEIAFLDRHIERQISGVVTRLSYKQRFTLLRRHAGGDANGNESCYDCCLKATHMLAPDTCVISRRTSDGRRNARLIATCLCEV